MASAEIENRGWRAYVAAVGGTPEAAHPLVAELRAQPGLESESWALAVEVAVWQALPEGTFPASPERVHGWIAPESAVAHAPAAILCAEGARTAWLTGRVALAQRWAEAAAGLPGGVSLIVDGARSLAHAWAQTTTGDWDSAQTSAEQASRFARSGRLAPFVVEATALQALAELARGDLEAGLDTARRSVRMARTEELAQPSYLAGLVLARARRLLGHFHLSSRILESLARVAPRTWDQWLAWERSLAGVPPDDAPEPAGTLNRWIDAFCTGDHLAIDQLGRDLRSRFVDLALVRADVDALAALVGMEWGEGACPPALLEQREAMAPSRASGFEGLPRPLGENVVAIVEVRPDGPAARRLALGAPIAAPLLASPRPGRPEAVIAALALAGPRGCDVPALFRHVYGFEYVKERHGNVLDVVLHRARGLLENRGEVRRDQDSLRFDVSEAFSVPDTALQGSSADRVLHSLSIRARGSAKEIAEDLQMPLRTVQGLLRELLDQGVCTQQRESRRVEYVVEDTTFKEPTSIGWRKP